MKLISKRSIPDKQVAAFWPDEVAFIGFLGKDNRGNIFLEETNGTKHYSPETYILIEDLDKDRKGLIKAKEKEVKK